MQRPGPARLPWFDENFLLKSELQTLPRFGELFFASCKGLTNPTIIFECATACCCNLTKCPTTWNVLRLWFNVWSLSFYILLSCFHSFTACFDCFQVLNFVEESSLNINFLFTFFISIFKTIYALYFIDIITVSIDLSSKALFSWNQNCMEFWWEYLWYMYSSS